MARPLRIEYPGAVYHVTSRGNGGQDIFLDDEDRRMFVETALQAVERFNWLCHAYCLMTNHYHLLVETVAPALSRGMRHNERRLHSLQAVNRRHRRSGRVFSGRFRAIFKPTSSSWRVVLNSGSCERMVRAAKDWPWSSYQAFTGLVDRPTSLTTD